MSPEAGGNSSRRLRGLAATTGDRLLTCCGVSYVASDRTIRKGWAKCDVCGTLASELLKDPNRADE